MHTSKPKELDGVLLEVKTAVEKSKYKLWSAKQILSELIQVGEKAFHS